MQYSFELGSHRAGLLDVHQENFTLARLLASSESYFTIANGYLLYRKNERFFSTKIV
jgi:hypothetical protein